jgi:hypothetical protein
LDAATYYAVCVDIASPGVGELVAHSYTDSTCDVSASTSVIASHSGTPPFIYYMDVTGSSFFIDSLMNGIFEIIAD